MSSAKAEGTRWGARAADWARFSAGISRPAWRAVADATGIAAGMQVLDLGCGSGEFCRLVLDRGARAAGVDAAAEMIELAGKQAAGADLRVGDLGRLPWPAEAFDVVTAFNALQFASDLGAALAEARRVLRRGGALAVCSWDGPGDVARVMAAALAGLLPRRDSAVSAPEPALEHLATGLGLEVTGARSIDVALDAPDRATMVRALLATGPSADAISVVGEEAVRVAVAEAVIPFVRADGSYRLENRFRYTLMRR